MKIDAKHAYQALPISHPALKFVTIEKSAPGLTLQSELRWLHYVLKILLHVNLVVAIASFFFSISYPSPALFSTGLLAVLAAITILVTTIQIKTNTNWNEVCIMTLCSVYAPFFVLWVASGNLLTIIISKM